MKSFNDSEKQSFVLIEGEPRRRDFLRIGGVVTAGAVFGACGGGQVNQGTFPVEGGPELAVGSAILVEDGPFVLVRDEGGLYAMSARCTHFGCTVSIGDGTFPCECHGTIFGLDGQVVEGPARRPLDHFRVIVDEAGAISVNTSEVVPATTRAALSG